MGGEWVVGVDVGDRGTRRDVPAHTIDTTERNSQRVGAHLLSSSVTPPILGQNSRGTDKLMRRNHQCVVPASICVWVAEGGCMCIRSARPFAPPHDARKTHLRAPGRKKAAQS